MYTTDGINHFVNSSALNTWASFANTVNTCLLNALGSQERFAIGDLTSALTMRLEWRPNIPQETLIGVVSLSSPTVPGNQYNANDVTMASLNANARFGLFPFNSVTNSNNQAIQSSGSIPIFHQSTSIGGLYGQGFTRFFMTACNSEVIIVATNDTYTKLACSCQGYYDLSFVSPEFSTYPQCCFSYQNFSQAYSANHYDTSGCSFWTDFTKISLLFRYEGDYAVSCANGEALNQNYPVTDFVTRANYADFNSPIVGFSKNLKVGIGNGFIPGTKYQISVDAGSSIWLCIGYFNAQQSNKRLLLRIIV